MSLQEKQRKGERERGGRTGRECWEGGGGRERVRAQQRGGRGSKRRERHENHNPPSPLPPYIYTHTPHIPGEQASGEHEREGERQEALHQPPRRGRHARGSTRAVAPVTRAPAGAVGYWVQGLGVRV